MRGTLPEKAVVINKFSLQDGTQAPTPAELCRSRFAEPAAPVANKQQS